MTTAADAQVATASGRSASATPARSGRSRSIAIVPAASRPRLAQPLAAGERLELARLLERVDAHVGVAPDRDPHAGVAIDERGEVAVAQAALGRGAGDHDGVAL